MGNIDRIIFKEFGRLYPIHRYSAKESKKRGHNPYYYCLCSCGNTKLVQSCSLRSGVTKSCGCLQKERVKASHFKHGHNSRKKGMTLTYHSWNNMIQRCTNPNNPKFKYYGGRGITVCDRWRGDHGFENFLADMGIKQRGLTIERIDNDGNYEPGNCKWATYSEQNSNKRY